MTCTIMDIVGKRHAHCTLCTPHPTFHPRFHVTDGGYGVSSDCDVIKSVISAPVNLFSGVAVKYDFIYLFIFYIYFKQFKTMVTSVSCK